MSDPTLAPADLDVDRFDERGRTSLFDAVAREDLSAVEALLAAGASPFGRQVARDHVGRLVSTPLMGAAARPDSVNSRAIFDLLLDRAGQEAVSAAQCYEHDTLGLAVLNGSARSVRRLLDLFDATPGIRNALAREANRALLAAVQRRNESPDASDRLQALLPYCVPRHIRNSESLNVLMACAARGSTGFLRLLLKVPELDPLESTDQGATALMLAARSSDEEAPQRVALLLPVSDPNAVDLEGKNALMGCLRVLRRRPEVIAEIVRLLAPKTNGSIADQEGCAIAALDFAIENGQSAVVDALLDHWPADELAQKGPDGLDRLQRAAKVGRWAMADLLAPRSPMGSLWEALALAGPEAPGLMPRGHALRESTLIQGEIARTERVAAERSPLAAGPRPASHARRV